MSDYHHDIEKYIKGELTPAERNTLERKALHDPFLADALEGAEQVKADEFSKDVASLNEQIAGKKTVTIWMWPARIAAGLVILLVSSYIVWMLTNPEPVQDLAFEKSETEVAPVTSSDSLNPATGVLSSPPAEQPSAGPAVRDKDLATRTSPSRTETSTTGSSGRVTSPQAVAGESEIKNEPLADAIASAEANEKEKVDEIKVTEPVAVVKEIEKEEAISRAKAFDDTQERKTAKKKAAAPAATDKSGASGLASSYTQNVIRGQVTSSEDGSPLPGVNVILKNSTIGTSTDEKGNYQITTNDSNPTIVYSFIGLQSTEVKVEDRKEVNVQMTLDDTQLSEVVVTGYGTQKENRTITQTVDMAHPENGNRAFKQYLENNIRYPELAKTSKVEGRVTVEFTIEPDGSLTNFTIIRGIGSGCDEELIRLVKEGPKWVPTIKDNVAVQDKAKVRLKFELPR